MTLSELATTYNQIATTLGEPPVRRFANRAAGERRLAAMRAKVPAVGLMPLRQYRTAYNLLVPKAQRLGIKAHIHTSDFESRAKGAVQLAKLRDAIAKCSG